MRRLLAILAAFAGIGCSLIGCSSSSPSGCAQVVTWYHATAKPALATMNTDVQQLNSDFANTDVPGLDNSAMQADGAQLASDALAVPADFPWSATGHGSGPAADAGKQWALLTNYSAIVGTSYQNNNPDLALAMLKASDQASTAFSRDMKACGVSNP